MAFLLFLTITPFFLPYVTQGVAGHGFVHQVNIGGEDYPGWNPFSDPYQNPIPQRVIRKIKDDGPVPPTSSDMNCNIGGDPGTSIVADIDAGSQVIFKWDYVHHQGPVSTYMASCGDDCTQSSASSAKWFKIDAGGYDPNTRQWAADQLRASGNTWTSTIPAQLKAGQYLMRHEIVALHSQTPQFYPSCTQVRLNGSGTGTPSDSDLTTIQDLYRGVNWPFIYGDFGTFTIPGPAPVTFGDNPGPSAGGTTTPRPSASYSSSSSTPTGSGISGGQQPSNTSTTAPAAAATGHCRLKSRSFVKKRLIRSKY
ncbi:Polysaccharide monooxygenase Cel61a [Leucoagaricus sp. SymC.cos]|nr:Polysaccharide monooxygenase Cel61a [Leucoagaricus sp. SymC.cos]